MAYQDISKQDISSYRIDTAGVHVFYLFNRSGEITFSLEHPKAKAKIFCIFDGKDTDSFSLKTAQKHIAPGSASSILVKSVLRDSARLDFSGNISIEKQANGVTASLENKNLLIGDRAEAFTEPNLEILANDVKCSHAVTTSSLSPDNLFTLASRGIPPKQAETLLISGFLDDVQKKIHGIT